MKRIEIECEDCGKTCGENTDYAGGWILLRSMKLKLGEYEDLVIKDCEFCSEKCMMSWLTKAIGVKRDAIKERIAAEEAAEKKRAEEIRKHDAEVAAAKETK